MIFLFPSKFVFINGHAENSAHRHSLSSRDYQMRTQYVFDFVMSRFVLNASHEIKSQKFLLYNRVVSLSHIHNGHSYL
jgi:hypothetical protein